MFKGFKNIPYALRKQVLIRSSIATIFLFVGILIGVFMKDILMVVPCIFIVAFFSVNIGKLLYDCYKNNYVVIVGKCVEIEQSRFLKKVKSICIETSEGNLRVHIRRKLGQVVIGDTVELYVSARTAMYFYRGEYGLCDYYAIEWKGKRYS